MPGAAPKTDYWDHFWQKGEASCCDDRGSPGRAEPEAAYAQFYSSLQWLGAVWQERPAGYVYRDTGALLQHTFQHRQAFGLAARTGLVAAAFSPIGAGGTKVAWRLDAARAGEGS